ncbi:2-keto-4-pentenoate hydratase [Kordiimonas pumila]|uniref:2-keto-4-pentenoate hydratase n=1 Tax=Kordiimonas pumila TaxID=2161677 RepID=A0ABV7D7L2_9PROT|nr:2-keto-4-pentenoate hydratase [Kordiimonas pumila]
MTDSKNTLQSLADRLFDAETSGKPCAPLRSEIGVEDLDTAYAIQQINVDRALASGRRLVGRKIGLTSVAVQKQLGVDQPDFGALFADMVVPDSAVIPFSAVMQPKVEAEIALVLGQDLTTENPTIVDLIGATDYVLPALEIVGSRIENWDIKITDTIADNASCGLIVLGHSPVKLQDVDMRLCGMVMERRGEPVSMGAGAACLGSPLNAALWLANKMVQMGTPLKAGDLVMTGALGPMVAVNPGDNFEARISGVGSVRTVFGEAS